MSIDLTTEEMRSICSVFEKYGNIKSVILFGSRAINTHRENSDVDLAIHLEAENESIAHVANALDQLPLPYLFDVINYDEITNENLKNHINKYGITIYQAV